MSEAEQAMPRAEAADATAGARRPVPFRGGGFAPRSNRWTGVLVFTALIALAEWGTRSGWITSLTLPR